MNKVVVGLLSFCGGYAMSMLSVFTGAYIACKIIDGGGGRLPFVPEPKGEVFTVETPEDMALFPEEEEDNEAEGHVLERTNKFLQTLGGGK